MKNLHNIKLSTEEAFSLVELIKDIDPFGNDKDLKSALSKLSNIEIPEVKHNLDYELPVFNPKVIK
tara:strand:- start:538 stop:735 length:198 start_codon:yes stop_codon:yes gene_type:complete